MMWFRSDLRVEDNAALAHACRAPSDGVVALFVIPADQWRDHDWGPTKVDFALRTLACLRNRLASLCIPLKVLRVDRFDDIPDRLVRLMRETRCEAVYCNREYEVNEIKRDETIADALEDAELGFHAFHDQCIIPPEAFRTGKGDFYTVFTPFKRKWIALYREHGSQSLPAPTRQNEIDVASDDVPPSLSGFEPTVPSDLWPAGEECAYERLDRFIEVQIDAYRDQRDTPGDDATSSLSADLAIGSISPRVCLARAIEANGGDITLNDSGASTWITELIWREFYRHVLVGFPRVCMHRAFKAQTERIEWRDDDAGFDAWCQGKTGFPIVDAGMRQLAQTGWMHNRVRMIVAMFLTKDLFIDWRRGEQWFARHLVDYDLASNNGGWQWSASTGTDAQPYFRIFNPWSQGKKCDPAGVYITRFVPELGPLPATALHDPEKLAQAVAWEGVEYPAPIVDHARAREHAIGAFKSL